MVSRQRRFATALLAMTFALVPLACGDDDAEEPVTEPSSTATDASPTTTAAATTASDGATTSAPATPDALLTDARDATAEITALLGSPGPTVERAEQLAQAVADALVAVPADCEAGPASATVVSVTSGEPALAVIEYRVGCDDSVGGARYVVTMEGDDTSGWAVASATRQDICLRGVDGSLCI